MSPRKICSSPDSRPSRHTHPVLVNRTLFGNNVFANTVELRSYRFRMSPNLMSLKEEGNLDTEKGGIRRQMLAWYSFKPRNAKDCQ